MNIDSGGEEAEEKRFGCCFSKTEFCFCIDFSEMLHKIEMLDIICFCFFLPMAGVQLKWFSISVEQNCRSIYAV